MNKYLRLTIFYAILAVISLFIPPIPRTDITETIVSIGFVLLIVSSVWYFSKEEKTKW